MKIETIETTSENMEVEKKEESKRKADESNNQQPNEPSPTAANKRRKWGTSGPAISAAVSTDTIDTILAETKETKKPVVAAVPTRIFKKAIESNTSNNNIIIPEKKEIPKPIPKVEIQPDEPRQVPASKKIHPTIYFLLEILLDLLP